MASKNRDSVSSWGFTGGSLLLGAPLLLLVGLAVAALLFGTSPGEVVAQLKDDTAQKAIILSLKTTLASLVLIVVFGSGIALAMSRGPGWLAAGLELLMTLPAILPPSVAGIALLLAFGRQGLLGGYLDSLGIHIAFTSTAVVLAQTFVAAPFFVRTFASGLQGVEPELLEAARIDGAGNAMAVWRILLPLSLPFLIGGAALSWARAVGEFGATILFAGSLVGKTQTMPLAIYLGFESNMEQAKALSVLLMLSALLVLAMVRLLFRRQLAFAH